MTVGRPECVSGFLVRPAVGVTKGVVFRVVGNGLVVGTVVCVVGSFDVRVLAAVVNLVVDSGEVGRVVRIVFAVFCVVGVEAGVVVGTAVVVAVEGGVVAFASNKVSSFVSSGISPL